MCSNKAKIKANEAAATDEAHHIHKRERIKIKMPNCSYLRNIASKKTKACRQIEERVEECQV